jgi:hypothetical protein
MATCNGNGPSVRIIIRGKAFLGALGFATAGTLTGDFLIFFAGGAAVGGAIVGPATCSGRFVPFFFFDYK